MAFDRVVVTFPDEQSAQLASEVYPQFETTCDPLGCRVGSGGGTRNALPENPNHSVLVIHAGGASSRCPTQMVLGKAFASLPGRGYLLDAIANLQNNLFHGTKLPGGTIVVVAGDCILEFEATLQYDWDKLLQESVVLGLAVPAPLKTAKNHGVFDCTASGQCRRVLQKPSWQTIQTVAFDHRGIPSAWIDTGVVVFSHQAAQVFRDLPLDRCTQVGLARLHDEHRSDQTLREFAAQHHRSVDLYTHILQALRLEESSTEATSSYLQDFGAMDLAPQLFDRLSPIPLRVLAAPNGKFIHLGTTKELVDYVVSTTTTRRHECRLPESLATDPSAVLFRCDVGTTSADSDSFIGSGSFLEHCQLHIDGLQVGTNCMLSSIRGLKGRLVVPDNTLVWMAPVHAGGIALCVLSLLDGIKKRDTVYGTSFDEWFRRLDLAASDIWDTPSQNVWTAKLHPMIDVKPFVFADYFGWVFGSNDHGSFQRWKTAERMSLAEIRDTADAGAEWLYQCALRKTLGGLRRMIVDRTHDYFDCEDLAQDCRNGNSSRLIDTVHELDTLIVEYWEESPANAARACTIMMDLLDSVIDKDTVSDGVLALEDTALVQLLEARLLSSNTDKTSASFPSGYTNWVERRDEWLYCRDLPALSVCSLFLWRLARTFTAIQICASREGISVGQKDPVFDQWVLANAPARVDLSGSWSDTPPICYEYGGRVIGVAVRVDEKKPVACRARILSGKTGLYLCSEARTISGDVSWSCQVEVDTADDLMDYNNPTSDCALLKATLVHLGLGSCLEVDFQVAINRFCGCNESVRLEIVTTSLLPQGSGLGTSSILAGCALSSIHACITGQSYPRPTLEAIFDSVLIVEQILTTGGGYQDQVNGLAGGFKLSSFEKNMKLSFEYVPMDANTSSLIEENLILVFTGKTRLAKNLLEYVLKRWARRSPEIVRTVRYLVDHTTEFQEALARGALDDIGVLVSKNWENKAMMAGESSGVYPDSIRRVVEELANSQKICGASLCGAGGGGFMFLLTKAGVSKGDLQHHLSSSLIAEDASSFTWHTCSICDEGLSVRYLEPSETTFTSSWME